MKGIDIIPYNDLNSLENKLKNNSNIVAFMVEPIQGEAGVIIPDDKYLYNVKKLCEKYNVLLIADEVQTGLGRTGKLLASDYDNIKPDILCLGKALSGGIMPISAVLADSNIMNCITPGTHGSTFGGNPLASAVAIEAIKIILNNKLDRNSYNMGEKFRNELFNINRDFIVDIRGKGLMNAIEFENKQITDKVCNLLIKNGILTKSTHDNILRMAPPLTINKKQMNNALRIIKKTIYSL